MFFLFGLGLTGFRVLSLARSNVCGFLVVAPSLARSTSKHLFVLFQDTFELCYESVFGLRALQVPAFGGLDTSLASVLVDKCIFCVWSPSLSSWLKLKISVRMYM